MTVEERLFDSDIVKKVSKSYCGNDRIGGLTAGEALGMARHGVVEMDVCSLRAVSVLPLPSCLGSVSDWRSGKLSLCS